jgi:hypothetical protein
MVLGVYRLYEQLCNYHVIAKISIASLNVNTNERLQDHLGYLLGPPSSPKLSTILCNLPLLSTF